MQEFDPETMRAVLKAVIALQGKVRRTLSGMETTLDYLREAERSGYIEGRGGFYNRGGGGSKRWHFLMLPEEEP